MSNCKNCDTKISQKYCPNCGSPAVVKRIDGHYIIHEIEHVLHLDRGILYTIKELLIRPGESVKEFISFNRNRLVKPIIFIVITSLIYSLMEYFFKIEEGYVVFGGMEDSTTSAMLTWVQGHYGYANILMGVLIALLAKLIFRKTEYNFFEILILLCFIMGIGMLIYAVFAILQGITKVELMTFGGIIGFIYTTWAMGQFFGKKNIWNYVKAFLAYLFGAAGFYALIGAIGTAIDMIIK